MISKLGLSHIKCALLAFSLLVGASASSAPQYKSGIATAGVNFRSGPGMKYRVVTSIPKGEVVEVIKKSGNWTQVRLETGKTGYIYSKYVGEGAGHLPDTEGGFCEDCDRNAKQDRLASNAVQDVLKAVNPASGFGACVTGKIIVAAKEINKSRYGNRRKGKGLCQVAVRSFLTRAGVWQGGAYGNAKDTIPGMLSMGFKNIYKPGMKPKDAPPGAILVYDKKRRGARCKDSKGNTYGHIELKASNNSWYYDGNPEFNIQQAYGEACRPLKGVMVMGSSCPTCSSKLKRACGG